MNEKQSNADLERRIAMAAGAGLSAMPAPTPPPGNPSRRSALADVEDRLKAQCGRLVSVTLRLTNAVERLGGSLPAPAAQGGADKVAPVAGNVMMSLHEKLGDLSAQIDNQMLLAERLDELV